MDKIFIERLSVRGRHGVSPEEREREGEFVLDISAEFDARRAGVSDNLSDTVDYNFFRDGAREIVAGRSFRLLEKLADAIAQKILASGRVKKVSVSIRKIGTFPDCTPGVAIARART